MDHAVGGVDGEGVDAHHVIPAGVLRQSREVRCDLLQFCLIGHRHHDVRQTGGHLLGQKHQLRLSGHGALSVGGETHDAVQFLQLLRRLQPLEGLGLGHVHEDGVLAHHHLQRTGERLIDVGAALDHQSHLLQSVEAADGGVAAQLHLRSGGEVADMEAVPAQGLDEGRLGVAQLCRRFPHRLICGELRPLRQQNDTCGVAAEGLPGKCIYDLEFHVLILLPDRQASCDAAALPVS